MEKLDLVKEQWARLPSRSEILRLALGAWRAVLVVLLLTGSRCNNTRFCAIECGEREPLLVRDNSHR